MDIAVYNWTGVKSRLLRGKIEEKSNCCMIVSVFPRIKQIIHSLTTIPLSRSSLPLDRRFVTWEHILARQFESICWHHRLETPFQNARARGHTTINLFAALRRSRIDLTVPSIQMGWFNQFIKSSALSMNHLFIIQCVMGWSVLLYPIYMAGCLSFRRKHLLVLLVFIIGRHVDTVN